jgi:hypothetical protein
MDTGFSKARRAKARDGGYIAGVEVIAIKKKKREHPLPECALFS